MTSRRSLPADHKIVQLQSPKTTNGGFTSGYISLKHGHKVWIIVDMKNAVGAATSVTLKQASAVAGTGVKTGPSVPVWANEDTVATDTLVKQTAWASAYTTDANAKSKQIVFEVDPAQLDVANGFDCVALTFGDSTQATNFANVVAVAQIRYEQSTPPSMILD